MTDLAIPERWLPVVGYEDYYEVSDFGNVRRVSRNLKPQLNTAGYPTVGLSVNGIVTQFAVHILVAAAHIGPRPAGHDVRHGPGGPLDASADNLCYGTKKQNQADRRRDGTSNRGEQHPMAKLNWTAVDEIRRRFAGGERQASLARAFGVGPQIIHLIVHNKRWIREGDERPRGGRVRNVLNRDIAAECRRRFAAGETQAALAREFGVSATTMHCAVRGKNYADPSGPDGQPVEHLQQRPGVIGERPVSDRQPGLAGGVSALGVAERVEPPLQLF